MAEQRQMAVDRVQQPEARDVRNPEVGQTLIFLPAHSGELRALGREDLDQTPPDGHDVFASRNVEQQPIRKDSRCSSNGKAAAGQRLAVDLQPAKSPRTEYQRRELELEQVLEKSVLGLEVLWTEQNALCPQHGLHLPHGPKVAV